MDASARTAAGPPGEGVGLGQDGRLERPLRERRGDERAGARAGGERRARHRRQRAGRLDRERLDGARRHAAGVQVAALRVHDELAGLRHVHRRRRDGVEAAPRVQAEGLDRVAVAVGHEDVGAVGRQRHRPRVVAGIERRAGDFLERAVRAGPEHDDQPAAARFPEDEDEAPRRVDRELERPHRQGVRRAGRERERPAIADGSRRGSPRRPRRAGCRPAFRPGRIASTPGLGVQRRGQIDAASCIEREHVERRVRSRGRRSGRGRRSSRTGRRRASAVAGSTAPEAVSRRSPSWLPARENQRPDGSTASEKAPMAPAAVDPFVDGAQGPRRRIDLEGGDVRVDAGRDRVPTVVHDVQVAAIRLGRRACARAHGSAPAGRERDGGEHGGGRPPMLQSGPHLPFYREGRPMS